VYVLDRSSSMGPDGLLRRAANAVRASLAELGPDTRFQIVAYNAGTTVLAPQPLSASDEAKDQADRWLASLSAEGGSNHKAGFRDALAATPDELFLLTDADDLEESDVRAIAALIRTPVRLSAAVFRGHRPAAVTPLERLVGRFNGSVQYVGP
jgi:Ca-activated chloride channel family protein